MTDTHHERPDRRDRSLDRQIEQFTSALETEGGLCTDADHRITSEKLVTTVHDLSDALDGYVAEIETLYELIVAQRDPDKVADRLAQLTVALWLGRLRMQVECEAMEASGCASHGLLGAVATALGYAVDATAAKGSLLLHGLGPTPETS